MAPFKVRFPWTWLLLTLSALAAAGCVARVNPSWPAVAQDEQTLYLTAGSRLLALEPQQGQVLWRQEANNGRQFTTPPRVVRQPRQAVLVGDQYGTMYAFDLQGQERLWIFEANTEQPWLAPVTTDGQLFFLPHSSGTLYALNPQGRIAWTFTAGGPLWAEAPVAQGRLFLPSMGHNLYALEARQGRLLWQTPLDAAVGAPPLVVNQALLVPTYGAGLYALHLQNGQLLWRALEAHWLWHAPVPGPGVVYQGTLQGLLFALDPDDGSIQWQRLLDGPIVVAPTWNPETQQLFVVTEGGSLWVLDPQTGEVRNQIRQEGWEKKLYTSPVPLEQQVLLILHENPPQLLAIDPETGQLLWQRAAE